MISLAPPQSSAAEWDAFHAVSERLAGFDSRLNFETIDGFLAALATAPQPPEPAVWLPVAFGDTFERVFADPADHAQALAALQARLRTLQRMLDPEALFDQPEQLRLDAALIDWNEDELQALRDGGATDEEVAAMQLGAFWSQGFLAAVQGLPPLWPEPPDDEAAAQVRAALDQIGALGLPPDALQQHLATYYPGREGEGAVTRDDLLAEACMSVQDLRMFCVDFAPVAATRRVEAAPGRNDPCPCGSGKKYKKCHGAAA